MFKQGHVDGVTEWVIHQHLSFSGHLLKHQIELGQMSEKKSRKTEEMQQQLRQQQNKQHLFMISNLISLFEPKF